MPALAQYRASQPVSQPPHITLHHVTPHKASRELCSTTTTYLACEPLYDVIGDYSSVQLKAGGGWEEMGWDGMGWDGMGWDGMGWDEYGR